MICPVCKKSMIVVEHHQIELDYCTKCTGVWFDAGELELLLDSAKLESKDLTIGSILGLPEVKAPHSERKCPVCSHKMKETAIGQPSIHIDACRQGDGIWFDGGELHQLMGQLASRKPAGAASEQPILDFLGEVFKPPE